MRVPDNDIFTGREVNQMLDTVRRQQMPENLSTVQASKYLGYSPRQWRIWADNGEIVGAWKDSGTGPWRLPAESCREQIRAKQERTRKSSFRGPYKKRQAA